MLDHRGVIALALGTAAGNVLEDGAQAIGHGQQGRGNGGREQQQAIAHPAKHTFADMRDGDQLLVAQHPAGAFYGVNSAEDAVQQFTRAAVLFQSHQVAIETVEPFIALDQKLLDYLIHFTKHLARTVGRLAQIHQVSSGGSDKSRKVRLLFHRQPARFLYASPEPDRKRFPVRNRIKTML